MIAGCLFLKADSTWINQSSGLVIQKVGSLRLDGYPCRWASSAGALDPDAEPDPNAGPDPEAEPTPDVELEVVLALEAS